MDTEISSLLRSLVVDGYAALDPAAASALEQQQQHRLLLSSDARTVPVWKTALWDSSTVEPAMLRAPFVMIMFIFLWGLNVLFFEKIRLQYYSALNIKTAPTSFIFGLAFSLLAFNALILTLSSRIGSHGTAAALAFFYLCVWGLFVAPWLPYRDERNYVIRMIKSCLFPSGSVAFSEILFADALTSLSKVFKDIGITFVVLYADYTGSNVIDLHNMGMIFVAFLASVPFWIRVQQCWVQFLNAPDSYAKFCISLNILKYFSAFPPIWLAAYASLGNFNEALPSLIALFATINTLFSFFWDTIMDWGVISHNRNLGTFQKRRINYIPFIFLLAALIINLVLRFAWAANRLSYFAKMHPSNLMLLLELAEIVRRSIWNVFRVEWEIIVAQERLTLGKDAAPSAADADELERQGLLH